MFYLNDTYFPFLNINYNLSYFRMAFVLEVRIRTHISNYVAADP